MEKSLERYPKVEPLGRDFFWRFSKMFLVFFRGFHSGFNVVLRVYRIVLGGASNRTFFQTHFGNDVNPS